MTFPHHYFIELKSYLSNEYFKIQFERNCTSLHPIPSGEPQESILSPFMYTLYMGDLPENGNTTYAIFADAVLLSDEYPARENHRESYKNN